MFCWNRSYCFYLLLWSFIAIFKNETEEKSHKSLIKEETIFSAFAVAYAFRLDDLLNFKVFLNFFSYSGLDDAIETLVKCRRFNFALNFTSVYLSRLSLSIQSDEMAYERINNVFAFGQPSCNNFNADWKFSHVIFYSKRFRTNRLGYRFEKFADFRKTGDLNDVRLKKNSTIFLGDKEHCKNVCTLKVIGFYSSDQDQRSFNLTHIGLIFNIKRQPYHA